MGYFALMQQDRLPVLRFQATDASGAVNLGSDTVYFIYRNKYQSGAPISGTCDTVSAISGVTEYVWNATDTISGGVYYGFFRISGSSSNKWSSFPNDQFLVFQINE